MTNVIRREEVFNGTRNVSRAVIQCSCGEEVLCYGNTNTCECGRDYNMSGQLLAHRSQWGEETGESPSDVVNGMDADYDDGDW